MCVFREGRGEEGGETENPKYMSRADKFYGESLNSSGVIVKEGLLDKVALKQRLEESDRVNHADRCLGEDRSPDSSFLYSTIFGPVLETTVQGRSI